MDLNLREDSLDLLKALQWIVNANKAKDLTFTKYKAKPLTVSLSKSTLGSLNNEPKEGVSDIKEDFAHLAPFLRGEYPEIVDTMNTDDW